MYSLSDRSRRKLRRAQRSDDTDRIEEARDEVLEDECERWARSKYGRYGLLSEDDCQDRAPALVQRAWAKLRSVSEERVQDLMDDYEGQEGGPPLFDAAGDVDRDAGGSTGTTWRDFGQGFQQVGSGRILVGSKYICRRRRPNTDWVVISIMKTLVHELLGHWDRIGQRVGARSGLSSQDRESVRKDKAERRADRITEQEWRRIRRTTAFELCEEECEDDFEQRKAQVTKEIETAIEEALN